MGKTEQSKTYHTSQLIETAIEQLKYSYTPYSGFKVGAALLAKDGVLTEYAPPCGVCRQVMMEFCDPEEFQIILATDVEHYDIYTLKELLPLGFGPGNLKEKKTV